MNAHAILTAIRELKKNDPAEFATFQKGYEEEMTEGVAYWGVNNGGDLTFWKLSKEVEDDFDCQEFGNKRCLGEDWGGLSSVSFRTITKEMVECEDFYEREEGGCHGCEYHSCYTEHCPKLETPVKEEAPVAPVKEEECPCGCGCGAPCYIDDPKTVRRENEKEAHDKKAMKDYVKARLNHLMGLGQKQMMDDGGDGEVKCLLTRREEWDGEEFDNIICSLCDKRDGELNAIKSGYEFSVGAEITEKDDKVWEISVSWSTLYDQIPFDDFYDEDEDDGSDSDDE
jgi:hypothetical protein